MARGSGRKRKEVAVKDKGGSLKKQVKEGMVRSGRRAAQNLNYDERVGEELGSDDEAVTQAVYSECETETEAVSQTGSEPGQARRLYKFEFFDERGEPQPLESQLGPLYVRAVVQPLEGDPSKKTGRFVRSFGPLVQWSVLYEATQATIQIFTNDHVFYCVKASAKYQPLFTHLREQVLVAQQIYAQLAPGASKGEMGASYDTVLQRLQRSKVKHGYCTWRQAICANASFLLQQMACMTQQHQKEGLHFEESPFALKLQEECDGFGIMSREGGIRIQDSKTTTHIPQSDELLARQLQAKEEAKVMMTDSREKGNGATGFSGVVMVAEEDIAADYPLPAMYEKLEEETDEFLMADEDIALVDPAYFPQRTLTDFAVYNSEGLLKTLELLPGWSGLAPTVELYGSGIVKEEEDEAEAKFYRALQESTHLGHIFHSIGIPASHDCRSGGSSSVMEGGQGSSSGAGGSGAGGSCEAAAEIEDSSMHVFLSQIQEYVVECDVDSVCISIRTEASWYKLQQPSSAYAPWFNVVVKCARIAIKIISMLLREARACKLSFSDVSALLAKESKDSEFFLSQNVSQSEILDGEGRVADV